MREDAHFCAAIGYYLAMHDALIAQNRKGL
jgi:hypothetical protein